MKTIKIFFIVSLFSINVIAQNATAPGRSRVPVGNDWKTAAESVGQGVKPTENLSPLGNATGGKMEPLSEDQEKAIKELVSNSRCEWSEKGMPSLLKVPGCSSTTNEAGIICMGSVTCMTPKYGSLQFFTVYCGLKDGRCPVANDCVLDFKIDSIFYANDGSKIYGQPLRSESDFKDLKKGDLRESVQ